MTRILMRILLLTDGLISSLFGVFSYLFPEQTFGTLFRIDAVSKPLTLVLLEYTSVFYILLGIICFAGMVMNEQSQAILSIIMIIRHSIFCLLGVVQIGKDWLIGNPYYDVVIQLTFISLYVLALLWWKVNRKTALW